MGCKPKKFKTPFGLMSNMEIAEKEGLNYYTVRERRSRGVTDYAELTAKPRSKQAPSKVIVHINNEDIKLMDVGEKYNMKQSTICYRYYTMKKRGNDLIAPTDQRKKQKIKQFTPKPLKLWGVPKAA